MTAFQKKLSFIIGCLFLGCLSISALYFVSEKVNHRKNGFIRLFQAHKNTAKGIFDLKNEGYHIVGATHHFIYLNNRYPSNHLLVTNYSFTDTTRIQLNAPYRFAWAFLKVAVDSPNIFLIEGFTPTILHAKYPFTGIENYKLSNLPFSESIPLSLSSFILKTYDPKRKQNTLTKESIDTVKITNAVGVLEKQVDGIFCTDGTLLYDKASNRLIYLYFYRNQFLCMDTNLNVIYKSNTIDTTTKAHIKIDTIKSENSITLSAPALAVNRRSCMNEKWLFVNSSLMANNEVKEEFDKYAVIDVYSTQKGSYQFSFYLPKYRGNEISEFQVFGKTMVVLYSHYLYIFHLEF